MAGTYEDPTNANGIIPWYLFNTTDASTHIFEFLETYNSSVAGSNGSLYTTSDWSAECSVPFNVFVGAPIFVGCLLYQNVTRDIINGSLPTNLTEVGFTSADVGSKVRSEIATCLATFCSGFGSCASTNVCDVGSLLTSGYELSAQGVAQCWVTLCSEYVNDIDQDFAGIGIVLSYILQTAIALTGFLLMTILTFAVHRKRSSMRHAPYTDPGATPAGSPSRWKGLEEHCAIIIASLADFQKAQCYFSIALQIGALATIFNDLDSTSWINQNFLLLVSTDGLIPIVLTLYTIMTFGQKSWYVIFLSVTTVVLAAVCGGVLASKILPIEAELHRSLDVVTRSSDSAACGGLGPSRICANLGPNLTSDQHVASRYIVAMSVLVVVTAILVLWKLVTETTTVGISASSWIARRLALGGNHGDLEGDERNRYERSLERVFRVSRILFHTVVFLFILACVCVEFYEFDVALSRVVSNWTFGQIVGLITWGGMFIDLAYVEYNGLSDGMAWRFPSWLVVMGDGYGGPPGAGPQPDASMYPVQYETDNAGTDPAKHPMGYSADYPTPYPATSPATYYANESEAYPGEYKHNNPNNGSHTDGHRHGWQSTSDEIRSPE